MLSLVLVVLKDKIVALGPDLGLGSRVIVNFPAFQNKFVSILFKN